MTALTAQDRRVIDLARQLAALATVAAVREHAGTDDTTLALAHFWGAARVTIADMAAIAERLGDDDEDQADEPEDDHWRDYNYACSTCGALIGMFIDRQGWLHYRGDGTTASPVEIYDAGHEATLAAGQDGAP